MPKPLNKNIQEAISHFGSQHKMAKKLNVSQMAVYKWLHCLMQPSARHALMIQLYTENKIKAEELLPQYREDYFVEKLKEMKSDLLRA